MTLQELRNRFCWVIGDNPAAPQLMDIPTMNVLLNDALRSLSDSLLITKTIPNLMSGPSGVLSLPNDFAGVISLKHGNTTLVPIDSIRQAAIGSRVTTQYLFTDLQTLMLYDVPPVSIQLSLVYKAYPPLMVNNNDVPSAVPLEYREALATVYVRSEYARRMGYMSQYLMLRQMWEAIKSEIGGVVEARTKPVVHQHGWRW